MIDYTRGLRLLTDDEAVELLINHELTRKLKSDFLADTIMFWNDTFGDKPIETNLFFGKFVSIWAEYVRGN